MQKRVFYVGYYCKDKKRNAFPSTISKMDYIIDVLNHEGMNVEVLSTCRIKENDVPAEKNRSEQIKDNVILHLCGSLPEKNVLYKYVQLIYSSLWLFFYLIKNVPRNEKVLVWHTCWTDRIVMFAKKVKGFKVVLEVGEIFSDVDGGSQKKRKKEIHVIRMADEYMYSTELLNKVCNPNNKPYIVVQGTYNLQKEFPKIFNDGKIHLVYAGILRKDKGVDVSIGVARYLSDNYVIHILGYGEQEDIDRVKKEIEEVNSENKAIVSYDGLLYGDEYTQFIQSCDVGLCTQSADVQYNTTAFPSKIISYLSNGLPVVAIGIESIVNSKVSHLLKTYDICPTPEEQIGKLVLELREEGMNKKTIRGEMERLDRCFHEDVRNCFGGGKL